MKEEMGTKTERGSRIANPLKRERERKWQPYKGVWNSFLQGLSILTLSILSLLLLPLTLTPIWLRLFSNLGDSNLLPAMTQPRGTLPSRTLKGSFKSVFFCPENATVGIVAAIGFYPCEKGEAEQFKTFVSRVFWRGLQLHADSRITTNEIYQHQRCFPVQRWQTKAAIACTINSPFITFFKPSCRWTCHQHYWEKLWAEMLDNINNFSRS